MICEYQDTINTHQAQIKELTDKLLCIKHKKEALITETNKLDRQLAFLDGRYHKPKATSKSKSKSKTKKLTDLLKSMSNREIEELMAQVRKNNI